MTSRNRTIYRIVTATIAAIAGTHGLLISCLADDASLRAVSEAYLANVESFSDLTCRFTVAAGYAKDDHEAIARGPVRDVAKAQGVWVRSRDVERYEIARDMRSRVPTVVESNGSKGMWVLLPPTTMLRDSRHYLSVSGIMGGGSIGERSQALLAVLYTPWNFANETGSNGRRNVGDLIADYLGSGEYDFSLTRPGPRAGLARVQALPKDPRRGGTVYFVDEERACIPLETWSVDSSGNPDRKVYVTDIEQCSRARWFPTRVVVSTPHIDRAMGVFVIELRVTSLDVDRPPAPSDLMVSLPAGTRLSVRDAVDAQVTLKKGQRVAAADIPSLIGGAHDVAKNLHEGAVPMSVSPEPRSWRPWIIAANALLVLSVVGYVLWRRNR